MITLYEIDEMAKLLDLTRHEVLICAYADEMELSPVCEQLAGAIMERAK